MIKILFLCHGNICRSVAAEVVALNYVKTKHLEDNFLFLSRGLSNEEYGNDIYPPMKDELRANGYVFKRHFAQKVSEEEMNEFDYIFYMDGSNFNLLKWHFPEYLDKCHPLTYYLDNSPIEDPWYTDRFTFVLDKIIKSTEAIIENLK